mmetsp:Transcript_27581/g.77071  ORF Transcript_27581/g.77071 Transcript_27581/m.77071 type:complete len:430 (+) Transcript_27581:31-1320(+)
MGKKKTNVSCCHDVLTIQCRDGSIRSCRTFVAKPQMVRHALTCEHPRCGKECRACELQRANVSSAATADEIYSWLDLPVGSPIGDLSTKKLVDSPPVEEAPPTKRKRGRPPKVKSSDDVSASKETTEKKDRTGQRGPRFSAAGVKRKFRSSAVVLELNGAATEGVSDGVVGEEVEGTGGAQVEEAKQYSGPAEKDTDGQGRRKSAADGEPARGQNGTAPSVNNTPSPDAKRRRKSTGRRRGRPRKKAPPLPSSPPKSKSLEEELSPAATHHIRRQLQLDEELSNAWARLQEVQERTGGALMRVERGREELARSLKNLTRAKNDVAEAVRLLSAAKTAAEEKGGESSLFSRLIDDGYQDTRAAVEDERQHVADARNELADARSELAFCREVEMGAVKQYNLLVELSTGAKFTHDEMVFSGAIPAPPTIEG